MARNSTARCAGVASWNPLVTFGTSSSVASVQHDVSHFLGDDIPGSNLPPEQSNPTGKHFCLGPSARSVTHSLLMSRNRAKNCFFRLGVGDGEFEISQFQELVLSFSSCKCSLKKIDGWVFFFLFPTPPIKGSERKGARTKSSECPLERSKAERSAQPAVAMKRNVAIAEHSQHPQSWRIPKRQNCTSLSPQV